MKVLVTCASKHGATEEIAQVIAQQLRAAGLEVNFAPADVGPFIDQYDAFVIGSAVYMGRWMSMARDLVREGADVLRRHPVWLFSSGPITGAADPLDSAQADDLLRLVNGREHRLFAGRLDKEDLGITERAIVRMVHSPWGDYRPWDEIRTWADEIAQELSAVPV